MVSPSVIEKQPGGAGVILVEGVILVLIGLAALAFPVWAGVGAGVLLGWLLMAGGIMGLVSAFSARPQVHFWWSLISSLLTLAAGLFIALRPLAGVFALIIVLAAWLAMDGVSSMMIALDARRKGRRGWGWLAGSAIFDWVLALVLIALGPVSGLVFVGVIIGIDLTLGGVALLAHGWAARKAA